MLNFGWAELMVIGVVALIVIGPEDLPDMFRQMGRFTAKLRQMSREFSRAMEQAAKETGVKDVTKDLKGLTSPKAMGLDAVKSAADKFEKWDPIKNAAKPSAPPMKPLVPAPMPAVPAIDAAATSLQSSATQPAAAQVLSGDLTAAETDPGPSDESEALDDLADWQADLDAAVPPAKPAHGAATQALYDKQAAKAAVIAEQTAKLKAIDDGTYQPQPSQPQPSILPPLPAAQTQRAAAPKKRVTKPKAVAPDASTAPAASKAAVSITSAAKAKSKPKPNTLEPAARPVRKSSKKADPS